MSTTCATLSVTGGGDTSPESVRTDEHCIDLTFEVKQATNFDVIGSNTQKVNVNGLEWHNESQNIVNLGSNYSRELDVLELDGISRFMCQSSRKLTGDNTSYVNECLHSTFSQYVNDCSSYAGGMDTFGSQESVNSKQGCKSTRLNAKNLMLVHESGWLQQWGCVSMACQHDACKMCNTCIHELYNDNNSQCVQRIHITTTNWYHYQANYKLPVFHIAGTADWLGGFM